MDESTLTWFNKLEKSINDFKEKYIEKTAEISSQLNSILVDHRDYDKRLDVLEKWKHTTEGKDTERERSTDSRFKKWTIIIISAEIVVAIVVAAGIKIIWK